MKDKHPAKVKLARALITPLEAKYRIPIFLSRGWQMRKARIAQQVIEREKLQKINKEEGEKVGILGSKS